MPVLLARTGVEGQGQTVPLPLDGQRACVVWASVRGKQVANKQREPLFYVRAERT